MRLPIFRATPRPSPPPVDVAAAQAARARELISKQQELARDLRMVDMELDRIRRTYSAAKGYLVPLRVEQFRREVSEE